MEQVIVLCAGWQTQVFLLRQLYGGKQQVLRADLGHASVLMVPIGRGFQPERPGFRQAELARQGLVRGRVVMEASELGKMVWANHENPMLGIYGAHLQLLSQQPDRDLLRSIIQTLHTMIGAHPDVTALAVWLDEASPDVPVYQAPPMLRSSWRIIVNASIAHPAIVPAGSLATYIAARVWGDGALLTWHDLSTVAPPQPIQPRDVSVLRTVLPQIVALLTQAFSNETRREPLIEIAQTNGLSTLEEYLLGYVATPVLVKRSIALTSQPLSPTDSAKSDEEQLQAWGEAYLTDDKLVKALSAPCAAIGEAVGGLVEKMKLRVL